MPPPPTSNIRAFVQWKEPSVYAGEEIECMITFRNIASIAGRRDGAQNSAGTITKDAKTAQSSRRSSVARIDGLSTKAHSVTSTTYAPPTRGHRPALSLSITSAPSRAGLHSAPLRSAPWQAQTPINAKAAKGYHGRSLSIMSLGSEAPSERMLPSVIPTGTKPGRAHMRSASVQISSKPPLLPMSAGPNGSTMAPRQPSPLYESNTPPALPEGNGGLPTLRPTRRRPGTVSANSTPSFVGQPFQRQNPGATSPIVPDFQFPVRSPTENNQPLPSEVSKPRRSPSTMHSGQHRGTSPRPAEGWSGAVGNLNPIQRVISESSADGTPRSSGEFYGLSNHSDETILSDLPYHNPAAGRLLPQPRARQLSRTRNPSQQRQSAEPETLMMGYAQTSGHFTLDGSLVNAAPFEEVKRKGVQGNGGVVGVERPKRASGMFGALSWGSIGESIGGLLGGDEVSSMAQRKAVAGSKTVPLLSTPQNLLFVDLRLAPGESASYHYRFALPRGLPPSHRGRAIKVEYNLVLGLQRPGGHPVKHVEVPFRVLGSVDRRGDILGHDLMSPYVILQDSAKSQNISHDRATSIFPSFPRDQPTNTPKLPQQGLEDFLRYTDRLLVSTSKTDNHGALLSPTSPMSPDSNRKDFQNVAVASTKEYIDFALLRANQTQSSSAQSPNRFNIARSGRPVAVLTLLRPACRLGEAMTGSLDFTPPSHQAAEAATFQAQTYALAIELESAERVDPSLALRSSSSIHRVTHKIHASARENCLYAQSVSFSLTVPSTATPTFETTGVSLIWRVKIEFKTARPAESMVAQHDPLMEEVGADERGVTMLARERLESETWEVGIPIRVYGAQSVDGLSGEPGALIV